MSDIDAPDWLLLERVATGTATAAEQAAADAWIGGDLRRRALFDRVRRIVDEARIVDLPPFDASASLPRVRARLQSSAAPPADATHWHRQPSLRVVPMASLTPRWRAARVAAGLIVAAGIGLAVGVRARHVGPITRTYTTARGERSSLLLKDGSRVWLAPVSRLTVPGTFGETGRVVVLEGEAFFSVAHDQSMPFTVRAAEVQATDVGTSFDVRAYATDRAVHVAVSDGLVSLTVPSSSRVRPVALGGGDVATVADSQLSVVHRTDIVSALDAWTSGRLAFRDTPLRDVLPTLARWYDVDVRLGAPSLAGLTLTASFRDEPIDEVLLIVARSVGARIEHRGSTIILLPTPTPRS